MVRLRLSFKLLDSMGRRNYKTKQIMKKLILSLSCLFIGLQFSSCGFSRSGGSQQRAPESDNPSEQVSEPTEQASEPIDKLIAQYDRDMDPKRYGHQAFQRVLQSLKNGALGINDAFTRSGNNGGQKCEAITEWEREAKPEEWQTFLIHIVEEGGPPGDHIPYFEYAKAKNADFKVWDMYGRTLLHLLLWDPGRPNVEKDLAWLLANTDVEELVNERMRDEGTHNQTTRETPLETIKKNNYDNLQAIMAKYVTSP